MISAQNLKHTLKFEEVKKLKIISKIFDFLKSFKILEKKVPPPPTSRKIEQQRNVEDAKFFISKGSIVFVVNAGEIESTLGYPADEFPMRQQQVKKLTVNFAFRSAYVADALVFSIIVCRKVNRELINGL